MFNNKKYEFSRQKHSTFKYKKGIKRALKMRLASLICLITPSSVQSFQQYSNALFEEWDF